MEFNFPWFSLIYFAGAVLTLILAIVVWKRQFAQGIIPFTWLLLSMTVWTLAAGLEAGAVEIPAKIIFSKVEYLGVVSSGALSLMFILEYTYSRWISRRRNLILLWIIPVLSLALVWTNELHHLVWSDIYVYTDVSTHWNISVWERGPLYWVAPLYQYLLYFSSIFVLLYYGLSRPWIYRQVAWLMVGSLIAIGGSIVYIAGQSPIKGFDLTPVSICIMGVIFTVTIFHFRLMDTLPAATKTFMKNLSDGFLLLDAEDHVISVNSATERIMEQTGSSLKGKALAQIWPELDKVVIANQSVQHIELMREKFGIKSYLDISIEFFKDRFNKLTGKLVIIRDVTELKLARLGLEEQINNRSQFTRAIVHELRNPLTAIISSSSELEENDRVDEKIRKALVKNISRASTDLEHRVNELLELARGEMDMMDINLEPVEMNQLVQEIGAEMEPVARKKGIKLSWNTPDVPSWVSGDKKRLRQVFFNILDNAIKYTDQGRITISSKPDEDHLLLTQVEDTGRGIEKEELDTLFTPHLRSPREKSKSTGLGIGLSLSKKYIELHKGKIWAESPSGKGTTINFAIPLYSPKVFPN
jgi:signal transduction histidine kinase